MVWPGCRLPTQFKLQHGCIYPEGCHDKRGPVSNQLTKKAGKNSQHWLVDNVRDITWHLHHARVVCARIRELGELWDN